MKEKEICLNSSYKMLQVDCIHRHPHYFYYWGWANNDFAILTLKTPLDLSGPNSLARAACLPNDDIPEFRHNQTMFTVSCVPSS